MGNPRRTSPAYPLAWGEVSFLVVLRKKFLATIVFLDAGPFLLCAFSGLRGEIVFP
jgi:hypothetical protein